MTKEELAALAPKVRIAIEAGKAAAASCNNDGGSANLDRVVIPVPGMRSDADHGLPGYLQKRHGYHRQGIHLDAPWPGQGNRHSAGVQAMHKSLKDQGVDCYVYYQVD
ncbi:hypothetical protein NJC40_03780 [Pseudomonas sp. 21LCFQ02]|uniref:hypothetical protein n=1 Tax=Pseudomonas sp. 21LCFQ02 TaxID=2957505 RepID=UPI00209B1507|nr:hypothetical protein [Pseudomonas sp. 21LCFQ02]MCO8166899.1 hypothetical protein [Pseudomonas sp. 21LCFQ02]